MHAGRRCYGTRSGQPIVESFDVRLWRRTGRRELTTYHLRMPKEEPIRVVLPEHLPVLTPAAARALLRILLDASQKQRPSTVSSVSEAKR